MAACLRDVENNYRLVSMLLLLSYEEGFLGRQRDKCKERKTKTQEYRQHEKLVYRHTRKYEFTNARTKRNAEKRPLRYSESSTVNLTKISMLVHEDPIRRILLEV